ncbi:MAG: Holliday junction branch migration DNA helicase RuvB [Candidatus Tectimicrobiota bacterium]
MLTGQRHVDEVPYEIGLRPQRFADFVGQSGIVENLKVFIEAASQRGEALDHVLFYGPPGLGKTTLAHIIAREMGVHITATSGPVLERPGDLAAIITNLEDGDLLFIDEIHRLPNVVEEILYPAMEDYRLDILIGQGPGAKTIKLELKPFTLLGATTRMGLLTGPLKDRFGVVNRLDFYSHEEIGQVLSRSSRILEVTLKPDGALEVARRSRRNPRVANRLLRRVRDFAQVRADGIITAEVAREALAALDVDEAGLDTMDQKFLRTIVESFDGGPVGIETLATALSEEPDTLEDTIEPYLIQEGFLKRTRQGRVASRRAYEHFGLAVPARFSEEASEGRQPSLL